MLKKRKTGVREIAAKLDLNISTVSRALNHSFQISKETTEAVLKTANEMGYHRQKNRKTIAIILPQSQTGLAWYSLNLINALTSHLAERKYYWEFINADKIDILQERSLCGMISIDFNKHNAKEFSKKYILPLICINDAPSHTDKVFSVNSDATSAIMLSFKCLYDYGHRKIAFLSFGNTSYAGEKRKEAFLKIAKEKKISEQCIYHPCNEEILHGVIRNLYRQGITGIITDGESRGLNVLSSLKYCKISVPKKMSLITWEMPYVSELIDPAVTTVGQNFDALAENAIEMLESHMNQRIVQKDILIPYKLHLRSTVDLPSK